MRGQIGEDSVEPVDTCKISVKAHTLSLPDSNAKSRVAVVNDLKNDRGITCWFM